MSVALIAGEGDLPLAIAARLSEAGDAPVVYALRGECDALTPISASVTPVRGAEFSFVLKDMTLKGVRRVIFAGAVPKTMMFDASRLDDSARALLACLSVRDDHTLLSGIVGLFERAGFEVTGYEDIVSDMMAPVGKIAGRDPSSAETNDIEYGIDVARVITPLSFGQSVVVSGMSVIAVEAMEGTDETIRRAGTLLGASSYGQPAVLVKMMKPNQDTRYDLPTVGVHTLSLMAAAGIGALAVHAGRSLIMGGTRFEDKPGDRNDTFGKMAAELDIAVIGVEF